MKRLRDAFQQQIKVIEADSISLPIEFSYAEPNGLRKYFIFAYGINPPLYCIIKRNFQMVL